MKTTGTQMVGETGMFSVGHVQSGRQNAKAFLVVCGSRVVGRGFGGGADGKAAAMAFALRCDQLVARWRRAPA